MRTLQPHLEIVALGGAPHLAPKQAFYLTARQSSRGSYVGKFQWIGQVRLHLLDDVDQQTVIDADAGLKRQPLALSGAADPFR